MSTSSTLGMHPEVLLPRAQHLHRVPCPLADPSARDDYDQAPGRYACVDQTGRKRKRHEYLVRTRSGTRCLFCWRRRPWEPI
jgi:hypothetical protein